jgi:hypothetical protein
MLVTFVNVVSCENPLCREFGKIPPGVPRRRFYYCPVCGTVSAARAVDARLAASPERYERYLREQLRRSGEAENMPLREGTAFSVDEQTVRV